MTASHEEAALSAHETPEQDRRFDVAIVGGGIVGLASAYRLTGLYPDLRVVVVEKEAAVASHQTGHNSGVIHSGIYYRPGSEKARMCVRGAELMKEFCRRHAVPFECCGKVVVATEEDELPVLESLHERAVANGVPGVSLIDADRLREIEPHAAGRRALHVPGAGIVDYRSVAGTIARRLAERGCEIRTGTLVRGIRRQGDETVLETTTRDAVRTRYMIGCAGLQSDRVARLEGARPELRIVPFRGEYYELEPARRDLVKGLIYPVPDPRFPFLGVHFTRCIDGSVEAGPNAVLALSREGYRKTQVGLRDLAGVLAYPGFWRLASRYWRTGLDELTRSFSKGAFVKALSRLVPEIRERDLVTGGAGIRAQALRPDGQLVDDFVIIDRPRALHVCNAPSPAATASLAIATEIVRRASSSFDLGAPAALEDELAWLS